MSVDAVRDDKPQQLADLLAILGDTANDAFYQPFLRMPQHYLTYLTASPQSKPLSALKPLQQMQQQNEIKPIVRRLIRQVKLQWIKKVPWLQRPLYTLRFT